MFIFDFYFKHRASLYSQGIPSPSLPPSPSKQLLSREILHWKINTRSGLYSGRASLASATSMGQKSLHRDLPHFKSFLRILGKTSWAPSGEGLNQLHILEGNKPSTAAWKSTLSCRERGCRLGMSWVCPWEVSPLKQSLSCIYTPCRESRRGKEGGFRIFLDLGYAFLRWDHGEGVGLHSSEGVPGLGEVWGVFSS